MNWFCNRGSLNVRFAPKATELLRRRELTRMGWTGRAPAPNRSEDDRGLRSTRSTSPCPIRQPLQSQQTSRIERLDIYTRPLDHVGPLVCVGCDALSELGRGSRYHGLTQVDQPGL